MNKSIKLKEGFSQVCVWPGTVFKKGDEREIQEFELGMEAGIGVKIQFLERILTNPDIDENGKMVPDTGGRSDIFFAVHKDDVGKFAITRLQMGIKWIEDVLAKGNYKCHIYPDHIYTYVTWNEDDIKFPEGAASAL